MMTPKMKEDFCTRILEASRQLFLSSRISEVCLEKGTQKQMEFVLELMNEELTLRDENRRKRLIKRAGFPIYKTFEGYSYQSVKFPPAFCREELETLEFVPEKKNLVLYGPVGIGKTHMAIAAGVKACNLGYKTKFYTVTELVLKLAEARKFSIQSVMYFLTAGYLGSNCMRCSFFQLFVVWLYMEISSQIRYARKLTVYLWNGTIFIKVTVSVSKS